VASQTVPILALAPMIVTALGAGWVPVAVISAYLTFFPVAVNTLRGLLSPEPMSLELMRSYAASPWSVLWKLRLPAALPYIFTALKVSATGSVVGAIVGELPSSRSDGLAAAILRASGNYAAEPEKLWATIIMASLVGILFFAAVTVVEHWVMRRRPKAE
jgi:NitT/TauT family transport system permease protein